MKRAARVVSLVAIVLFVSCIFNGCATTTGGKMYDSLTIGLAVYDSTMQYLGDAYRAGKLTETQKDQAVLLGNRYKLAWTAAGTAMAKYTELVEVGKDGSDAQKVLNIAMESMLEAKSIFLDYVATLDEGG